MTTNSMKLVARILIGLVALFILFTGLQLVIAPAGVLSKTMMTADGAEAMSNVRALWGAAVSTIGISVLVGAIKLDLTWVRPGALFALLLIGTRILSLIMDGSHDRAIIYILVPVVVFAMLLAASP